LKAKLVFKASRDGQKAEDFHKKADGVSPTVTFAKLESKVTVAAYTSKPWISGDEWGENVRDS
jgi:hypothetical protein